MRTAHQPLLTLERVGIAREGQTLLHEVSLCVSDPDELLVVLGPNGAGKSLLLRLIARLMPPDQGKIFWHRDLDKAVALVFQSPVVLRRTVRQNLLHALKIYGEPKEARAKLIDELLRMGDLTQLASRQAPDLSGGERQRLALLRALARRPRLLLLDEPTASLDPKSTRAIESLIKTARCQGVAIILVTHDLAQTRRLASKILFLHGGKVSETISAQAFFNGPSSPEGRAYLKGQLLL